MESFFKKRHGGFVEMEYIVAKKVLGCFIPRCSGREKREERRGEKGKKEEIVWRKQHRWG